MSRRRRAQVNKSEADPIYKSVLVTRFINVTMHDGKRSIAEKKFYEAMEIIKKNVKGKKEIQVFEKAIENVKPVLEVKSRRVGGATYQIPIEVRTARQSSLAIRWLMKFARLRHERGIESKIAYEIIDAYNNTGGSVRKKEEIHRIADSNRAFAHYRW